MVDPNRNAAPAIKGFNRCKYCGSTLLVWTDIASALEEMMVCDVPDGLRPMIMQAIQELRELKTARV